LEYIIFIFMNMESDKHLTDLCVAASQESLKESWDSKEDEYWNDFMFNNRQNPDNNPQPNNLKIVGTMAI
jgi:hypothetical protein